MRKALPSQPIGVFDSGIGGLTVANAINQHLPKEEIIYFGDTAHLPYGDKSVDAIRYYCIKISKFLLDQGCKMIVIACNTASAAAYDVLLDFFEGQAIFVNVVDPLVEAVASQGYRKVGVIATKATIHSDTYRLKLLKHQSSIEVVSLATPLLAPMIEEGFFDNNISHAIIDNYLSHDSFKGIEGLLLSCTHYPLIRPAIEKFFDHQVKIYDSTNVVAEEVALRLEKNELLSGERQGPDRFYISDYTPSFEETTRIFYNEKIKLEHCAIW
ncbi:MAG: glutamate racemase [Bacteroidota bacterium]